MSRQEGTPDSTAATASDRLDALVSGLPATELEPVLAASSLVPVLSANAEMADATRRLPAQDITALREAGLLRLATPRAYGGHKAGACAATAIAAELGRGCSLASWVLVLVVYYTASVALWLFPDEVRHLRLECHRFQASLSALERLAPALTSIGSLPAHPGG